MFSGDIRANEQPGLSATHTVWSRFHNDLVASLSKINPKWNPHILFEV